MDEWLCSIYETLSVVALRIELGFATKYYQVEEPPQVLVISALSSAPISTWSGCQDEKPLLVHAVH